MEPAQEKDGSISHLSYATSFVGHALLVALLFVLLRYPVILPPQRLIEVTIVASAASPLPQEQVITQDAPLPLEVPKPLEQQPIEYPKPSPEKRMTIDQPVVDAPQVSNVTSQEGAQVRMFMEAIHDAAPLYSPPPRYPEFARKHGYEGVVMLQVKVSPWGLTEDVRVVGSSGYEMLDEAAVTAVRDWRFEAAQSTDGDYVSTVLRLPIVFKLD